MGFVARLVLVWTTSCRRQYLSVSPGGHKLRKAVERGAAADQPEAPERPVLDADWVPQLDCQSIEPEILTIQGRTRLFFPVIAGYRCAYHLRVTRLIFLLALAVVSHAADNTLSAAEKAAGWVLLFDGKSTAGWLEVTGLPFPTDSWRIEDGSLRAFNPGHGFQDIRSEVVPQSYEFRFDWKIAAGGNSGVKYLVQKTDRWTNAEGLQARARGLEYQLFDDAADLSDSRKLCGALYDAIAPSRAAARPVGEFNHSLLVVRGGHVEHWLNGVKVVEFETSSPLVHGVLEKLAAGKPVVSASFISLQNHGSPAWFRNLKLRRLER